MLTDIPGVDAVHTIYGGTGIHKSIDRLCTIIQEQFSTGIDHALFLFCGHRCGRIKAILKGPDGTVLIYKQLIMYGRYR